MSNCNSSSIFRNTIKYGDQFFIRDPETHKLYWCDPANVEKVIVNESEGKKIETYFIKNLEPLSLCVILFGSPITIFSSDSGC
mgnify:CR=1 FL=1